MEHGDGTRTALVRLESAAVRFADVLRTADLSAPVPTCAPWRLVDLAHHLGGIHRWARTAVVEGRAGDEEVPGAPVARAALVDWFVAGYTDLLGTLRATDPGAPCWTFGPPPRVAGFWMRRQAHETTVHAHDAELVRGAPEPIPDDLARGGVDEVVTMFLPRQIRLGRTVLPAARLTLADRDGARWEIGDPGAAAPPAALVSGPAEALYLLCWCRIGLDDPRLTVEGDRAAAEAVLACGITP